MASITKHLSSLGISRVCHDPDVMQRIYDIGRKAGETAKVTFDEAH